MTRLVKIFFHMVTLALAITMLNQCVGQKSIDPGTEDEAVKLTPTFTKAVGVEKLSSIGKPEIAVMQTGNAVNVNSPIFQICPTCCLTCQYTTTQTSSGSQFEGFKDDNTCIDNVENQFNALNATGEKLEAYASVDFIHRDRYTEKIDNTFGLQNHVQGVMRLRRPGFFAVAAGDPPMQAVTNSIADATGADFLGGVSEFVFKNIFQTKNRGVADIWIIQFDSKFDKGTGQMGSNMNFGPWNYPHPWDTITVPIELEKGTYWHPGGIDALGDIISIPIQAYLITDPELTKTVFLYVNDPKNPVRIEMEVPFGGANSSMYKLPSGHYLLKIGSSYMLSHSTNFADGFDHANRVSGGPGGGSTTHFVKQCDGKVFMTGAGNTGSATPTFSNGDDKGTLYEVDFTNTGLLNNPPTLTQAPTLTQKSQRTFNCYSGGKYCNFDASASAYIDPDKKKLAMYGIYHFRTSDEKLKMREFY